MKNRAILIIVFFILVISFLFADPPDWETLQGTQYSMVVMANISLYGTDFVFSGNNMAAAFGPDGENDCRSVASWQSDNPPYYEGFWFFTIVANIESELITFKIYDEASDAIYSCDGAVTFVNNTTVGTPQSPYNLNVATNMLTGTISISNMAEGSGNIEDVFVTAGSVTTHPNSVGFYSLELDTGVYDVSASLDGYLTSTLHNIVVEAANTTENVDMFIVDWQPISGTQYSMVVMANIVYDVEVVIGNSDYKIAAFGNGGYNDCRGIAYWQIPNPPYWDGYWYITILSNTQGDQISFKLFDENTGDIIDCYQTLSFQDNATVGSPEAPWEISNGSWQAFNLSQGWNWLSFNVLSSETSIDSVFYPIKDYIYQVKSQSQSATYYSGPGMWVGDLNQIDITNGYLVFMNDDYDNFTVSGTSADPSTSISLTSGWNWISYLPQTEMAINNAFQSILDNVYQVKNQTNSATYYNPPGTWVGDLQIIQPGKCYKVNMDAEDNLIYQSGRGNSLQISKELRENEPNWQPITGTQYSMVLMADVTFNEEPFTEENENNIVAAFGPGGEDDCRAIAVWEDANPPYWDGYWYFTIVGDENDEDIIFKIYNADRDSIYACEETLSFANDQTIGDPFTPYQITALNDSGVSDEMVEDVSFLGKAYPNPFSINSSKNEIRINYNVQKNDMGKLEIFNLKGQKIRSYPNLKGNNSISWNIKDNKGNAISSGIYFYRLKTASLEHIQKLIITK